MPPAKDLESVRDNIYLLFNNGTQYQEILNQINELLSVRGQQQISLRTLKTQLAIWGLSRQVDLNPLYEEIAELFESGLTNENILNQANQLLHVRGSQPISFEALRHLYPNGASHGRCVHKSQIH